MHCFISQHLVIYPQYTFYWWIDYTELVDNKQFCIVTQCEQGKHSSACRTKWKSCLKLRYISSRAFILLQQWMDRPLSTFNKPSVNMHEMRHLQLCEFCWLLQLLWTFYLVGEVLVCTLGTSWPAIRMEWRFLVVFLQFLN